MNNKVKISRTKNLFKSYIECKDLPTNSHIGPTADNATYIALCYTEDVLLNGGLIANLRLHVFSAARAAETSTNDY
jgi:hypothetical protein